MKNTMKRILATLLAFTLVLSLVALTSCSSGKSDFAAGDAGIVENGYGGGFSSDGSDYKDTVLGEENRKIIKNVNESVQTDDFAQFFQRDVATRATRSKRKQKATNAQN